MKKKYYLLPVVFCVAASALFASGGADLNTRGMVPVSALPPGHLWRRALGRAAESAEIQYTLVEQSVNVKSLFKDMNEQSESIYRVDYDEQGKEVRTLISTSRQPGNDRGGSADQGGQSGSGGFSLGSDSAESFLSILDEGEVYVKAEGKPAIHDGLQCLVYDFLCIMPEEVSSESDADQRLGFRGRLWIEQGTASPLKAEFGFRVSESGFTLDFDMSEYWTLLPSGVLRRSGRSFITEARFLLIKINMDMDERYSGY